MCVLPLSQILAAEPETVTPPFAQTSPATSAPPAAAAPTSESIQAPSAAAPPPVAAPPAADTAKDAEELGKRDKRLRSQGYKPKVVNGTTFYCRGEVTLGSHFEKQVCGTADQMERVTRDSKDMLDDIQRRALQANPSKN